MQKEENERCEQLQSFPYILLHKNREYSAPHNQRDSEANTCITYTTLLKVLPVKFKGHNDIFNITALLDEGSTATLIDSLTATKLGLTGSI